MPEPKPSSWQRISPARSLVREVLHFARATPSYQAVRTFQLSKLVQARQDCTRRIAWPMIFIKAYALMAVEFPVLRRCYMPLPWPHLYEHDAHVARLSIRRQQAGEDWVLWGRFLSPESESLGALQERLAEFQTQPIERAFRQQFRLAHLPWPLRRLAWWMTMRLSGRKRSKRMGTYFLTTVAGSGAALPILPCSHTSGFSNGPIDAAGACQVIIAYDHRLIDGYQAAQMLRVFEEKLCGPVLAELESLDAG